MSASFERRLPISGTYNVRDLGGYAAAGAQTRWRRILRADALHRLEAAGVAELYDAGVRTVIDLRHGAELESAPNPFRDHPGVRYVNISLFDQLVPPGMGGADKQTDVLLELYILALAERQGAIREVLATIAEAGEGAVLFHCTAGKDRTGIIAALMLAVAGVETEVILDDYALTGPLIAPMIEELIAGAVARGSDPAAFKALLGSAPETMRAMLLHVEERYGSVGAYLELIGLDAAVIERLRARLVALPETEVA
jgi:protein-tyrosine phosphatase